MAIERSDPRPRLLIISNDVMDEKMGGPGLRYMQISQAMCADVDITLAVPNQTSITIPGVKIVAYQEDRASFLKSLVDAHEIVLISGYMAIRYPFLYQVKARLIVDLYDPFFLENMFYYLEQPLPEQVQRNQTAIEATNRLLQLGDFFICGTERQRDFWFGMLAANGRINPQTFTQDSTLRSLLDVVGVGYFNHPVHPRPIVRGSLVPQDAKIVLWGGGIWNWLDPLTLINAWPQVIARHPDAKLIFLGTRNPNPTVPEHQMARQAIALAETIAEKDKSIFFIAWLPYQEHQALLREADIGVSFQPDHIETRFAIRTRVIDYFGAGLPALVSEGDVTAEWIQKYAVGRVVAAFDVTGLAEALIEMLAIPKTAYQSAFERLMPLFEWKTVAAPLRIYCLEGGMAVDRNRSSDRNAIGQYRADTVYGKAYRVLRQKGLFALIKQVFFHLGWRMRRK